MSSLAKAWQRTQRKRRRLLTGPSQHPNERYSSSWVSQAIIGDSSGSLHILTERTATFKWTDKCTNAFYALRQSLCSTSVQISRVLDTDASDMGIGAVLSQIDGDGNERVIGYGSRLLTKPERRYCVTRRELLAVPTIPDRSEIPSSHRPWLTHLAQEFQRPRGTASLLAGAPTRPRVRNRPSTWPVSYQCGRTLTPSLPAMWKGVPLYTSVCRDSSVSSATAKQ